jgi:hypothetical protein
VIVVNVACIANERCMSVEIVRRCLNRWLRNGERKKMWVRIEFECFLMDDAASREAW